MSGYQSHGSPQFSGVSRLTDQAWLAAMFSVPVTTGCQVGGWALCSLLYPLLLKCCDQKSLQCSIKSWLGPQWNLLHPLR